MQDDPNISKRRDPSPRRVTAQDVAKEAGVSRSAVSRAFTPGASLDAEKRNTILAAAFKLGYRPNALAAGLSGGRSHLVAIFVGDMRNAYDSEVVAQLVGRLNALGKWPILIDGGGRKARDALLGEVFRYPLDALIMRAGSMEPLIAEQCAKLNIPVICSGRIIEADQVDNVCCRNLEGSASAARLLIDRGRHRIAHIRGPESYGASDEREAGMRKALAQAGLAPVAVAQGTYTVESGYQAARDLFGRHEIDALHCANDAMAIGALGYLRECGVDVPGAVSVTGFDDIAMAAWPGIRLTTVQNPIGAAVSHIVDLLERRLSDPQKPSEVAWVETQLVLRDTH
ncbi:DNA-binding transcriptional regulator, LacI/PurR family [Celeribacter neptunius]|uniref:DNA-binding transcriptional regulator, LacI/PurR family n=1 Tax=Celeribacter neptunius TaxID=588602 RepID=A0A1I3QYL6_9RHOB|nr:DNA-binding transcriptional regulator, LacI/PurR family [Celeribacter neptunius]